MGLLLDIRCQPLQRRSSTASSDGENAERDGGCVNMEVIGENSNVNCNNALSNCKGDLGLKNSHRCLFVGCKLKPMAFTSFCHLHMPSRSCTSPAAMSSRGPITCGKPILRSSAPSLCNVHFQKAQKQVTQALKKAGLNVSSSTKLAPKFHVIVAEYVRQIQAKRKTVKRGIRKDRKMEATTS